MQSSKILISFFSNQKWFICSAKWHTDVFWLETHRLNSKMHGIFSFQRSLAPPETSGTTPRLLRTTWMIRDQNRFKISGFAFRIIRQSLLLLIHEDRQMQTSLTHGLQNGFWLQSNSVQQPALHCKHHLFIWVLLSLKKKKKRKPMPSYLSCVRKCRLNVHSELKKKKKKVLERS